MEKTVNIKMAIELYEKLRNKAREMNVSIASVIRIAITEYLKKEA